MPFHVPKSVVFSGLALLLIASVGCTYAQSQEGVLTDAHIASPSFIPLTLRTWSGGSAASNVEVDVIDFWAVRDVGYDTLLVWYARRDSSQNPEAPIEVINATDCPAILEALQAFEALDPPTARFRLRAPGPDEAIPIPPTRKDGWDFRIAYRAHAGGNVQVRFLPTAHYDWAETTRQNLEVCWDRGQKFARDRVSPLRPSARPEPW